MGVIVLPSTIAGGFTPICNSCGVTAEYDISSTEYWKDVLSVKAWDRWLCNTCRDPFKRR